MVQAHGAVDRLRYFSGRCHYALPLCVVQFFPSLNLTLLHDGPARVIADANGLDDGTLWLCDQILQSSAGVLAGEYDLVLFPGDTPDVANRSRCRAAA